MGKQMVKLSQGTKKCRGVSWFPELTDKSNNSTLLLMNELRFTGKSIKTHLYWAMKNCECSAEKLHSLVDNITKHYQVGNIQTPVNHGPYTLLSQGQHSGCHHSSSCHMPNYTPSKDHLTDPRAIQSLANMLRTTYIYHFAQDFCRVSYV